MRHKILLADKEPEVINLLSVNLRLAGFQVITARDGASALDQATDRMPSLIVLDLDLPQIPGFALIRQLKADASTRHIPIIILTAQSAEQDRILGFELGADDYVAKPFSVRETILRIRKSLERAAYAPEPPKRQKMTFGDLALDPVRHEVTLQTKLVHLTPIEFRLLAVLMAHQGSAFDRKTLLDEVWGSRNYSDSRTIDAHVKRLRQKLGQMGRAIETVTGFGYRLNENPATLVEHEVSPLKLDYIDYPLDRSENGKPRFRSSKKSHANLLALK